MLIQSLGVVFVGKTVNKDDKRRVNNVYFSGSFYDTATVKDVVGELLGRLNNRERW